MKIMKFTELKIGKTVLVCCNTIFLICGVAIVSLGGLLLADEHRILLSRLLGPSHGLPHPVFYYVALGLMATGLAVCATSVLGCWASCGQSLCLLATYVFLLVVLLLGESTVGALIAVCPQYLGIGMSSPHLLEVLQQSYGVPGREQVTAAVDLVQTVMNCCGVNNALDYETSWWHLKELGQRELRVPLSCCLTNSTLANSRAFLDPQPLNSTVCQASDEEIFMMGRHTEGCVEKLKIWFQEHRALFLAVSLALVLVELSTLLSAILACVRRPQEQSLEAL